MNLDDRVRAAEAQGAAALFVISQQGRQEEETAASQIKKMLCETRKKLDAEAEKVLEQRREYWKHREQQLIDSWNQLKSDVCVQKLEAMVQKFMAAQKEQIDD